MSRVTVEEVVAFMADKMHAVVDIQNHFGVSETTSFHLMRRVKAAHGTWIAGWQKQVNGYAPLYAVGYRKDLVRPKSDWVRKPATPEQLARRRERRSSGYIQEVKIAAPPTNYRIPPRDPLIWRSAGRTP